MDAENEILELIETAEQVFDDVVTGHELVAEDGVAENAPLAELLCRAKTVCLPLGQEIDASLCMACDHFIGCHRAKDGSLVLQCWTHRVRLARGTRELPVVQAAQ